MAFNTISMKNPTKKQKPKSLYPAYKATKVEQSEWTQVVTRGVDPSHQDTIISMTPKESIQQFHKLISRVRVCKYLSVSTFQDLGRRQPVTPAVQLESQVT